MWINGELIEADVVEKQRAREIYETILREKRDPGLLEWAGGNIFKARVFPIEAHSEKRIKITYTQVLPMRANKYKYSYALRSEMLQKTPLRELSLDVQVSSALPLKSVTCPTHSVRTDMTDHAASVEFSAQEFTPKRDFEIVCEVNHKGSDVVVVPHQRGDDGYFLAQLTPPSAEGSWQRDILPNGDPVEVLLVCDTSGSMDRQTRKKQQEFVASILSALGKADRFNIASCDVDTQWFSGDTIAADAKTIDQVSQWLNDRPSLGWTDLDRMAEVIAKYLKDQEVDRKTHVIYVGDGIATARDANPQAAAVRLRGAFAEVKNATFHSISIGSSFESGVLQALASIGGGSVRQIDGEQTAQRTALELLNEMMQPGLTDLKVEFRGIEVAAVYPERLPNLAAGTQQIIVGRYLPTGENQSGEIVITGKRNGEAVRFASRITMDNADTSNSFIPRLWARKQLDFLLEQGSNSFVQDEVIALSEEFHIMTPYTSLLVLETDADRERFGVKRRFQMRDGERFFAEGRSKASFELLQKQMKAAGNWRLQLRRQVLRELASLGRVRFSDRQGGPVYLGASARPIGSQRRRSKSNHYFFSGTDAVDQPMGVIGQFAAETSAEISLWNWQDEANSFLSADKELESDESWLDFNDRLPASMLESMEKSQRQQLSQGVRVFSLSESNSSWSSELLAEQRDASMFGADGEAFLGRISRRGGSGGGAFGFSGYYNNYNKYTDWINQLAPTLAEAPTKPKPIDSKWDDDVKRVLETLRQSLDLKDGQGIEVALTRKNFDPRWDRQTSGSIDTQLTNGKRWLSAPVSPSGHNTIDWCDDKHRGNASRPWKLGRRRAAAPTDVSQLQPGQRPWANDSISRNYQKWAATISEDDVKNEDQQKVRLTLTAPKEQGDQTIVFTIDTNRNVVLSMESTQDGKLVSKNIYSDYVQAAGCWWPQTIETFDKEEQLTSEIKQSIKVLPEQAFDDRYAELKPDEAIYQLIDSPTPTVSEARTAAAGATAGFDDYLVLILDACRIQNWDMAFESLQKLKAVAAEKPCLKAIERNLLVIARRNQEALLACRAELERLAADGDPDETYIALQLIQQANGFADNNERLELLDIGEPIFIRNKDQTNSLYSWQNHRVNCLNRLNRTDEAIALQREVAEANPWQYSLHTSLAQNLSNAGEYAAGVALLEKQIKLDSKWRPYELNQLYSSAADLLRNNQQRAELVELMKKWLRAEPTDRYAYSKYLAALVDIDQLDEANETAKQWMQSSMRPEKLPEWELSRLRAAIAHALGEGYTNYRNWGDPIWHEPLLDVAKFFLKHEHDFDIPNHILVNSRYNWTEQAKQGMRMAAELLKSSAAEMKPDKVASLVNLLSSFEELEKSDWLGIAETLRKRWDEETDAFVRQTIGRTLTQLYAKHAPAKQHIAFLQARLKRARDEQDESYLLQRLSDSLFTSLLEQPWNDQVEDAAFDLLNRSSYSDDPAEILSAQIQRLQQLNDAMKNGVFAVADEQLRSNGHPEKLTRRELAERRVKMQQSALEHVVDRLTTEHEQRRRLRVDGFHPGLHREFVKWMHLELMHFRVLAADKTADNLYDQDGDFGVTIKACRKIMGEQPVATPADDWDVSDLDDSNLGDSEKHVYLIVSKRLRQERAVTILSNLALRKSAPKELAGEVLAYIQMGMKLDAKDADRWTNRYRMMLLALDRPEELEQNLRKSLRESDDPALLQLMLARLLAEQGKIEDAIGLAEAAQKAATLSPSDLSTLAQWYLVADRPDDFRQARVATFMMIEENQISSWLNQNLQPWTRTDTKLPSELDEDVLFAFEAVFKKSQSPGNYCYPLRRYYAACRDFRLLQMIPDAVIGRTPQQVYPFLTELNSNVLTELRNEATMDEIVKRINELRKTKTSSIDLRALDLLEAMVRRKGAEILNQPGPHAKAAVAAMQRAFDRDWAEGEQLQMAEFLKDMGQTANEALAAEQLREIRQLHTQAAVGSDTHFKMSWYLAQVLGWNDQQEPAIRVMEVALRAYHEQNPPGLPVRLNRAFNGYLHLLEAKNRFGAAEKLLLAELDQARNAAQTVWLKEHLMDTRVDAYRKKARISLGEGPELYRNLLDSLLTEADLLDQRYRFQAMQNICWVFQATSRKDNKTYKEDLRKYAFEQFPKLVAKIDENYGSAIDRVAKRVHDDLGPREAIAFLIERLENYPDRYQATYEAGWRKFGSKLGKWRKEAKDLGDLEGRLLELALAELRQGLITQDNFRGAMLFKNTSNFWKEKAGDFARTANEVAEEHKDSAAIVVRAAKYLFDHLHKHGRAISLMQDARKRGILSESQELTLAYMLRDRKRWKDLVLVLDPIAIKHPDEMNHRSLLIKALSLSGQKDRRDEMLSETEAYFRKENLWTELNVALLAKRVYEAKMYKVAVRLYDELIPMYQRERPNQSAQPDPRSYLVGGDDRLSTYYQNLARSHAHLRDTIAAVDAAAAGIVARGQKQSARDQASLALTSVILSSRNRDGLIAHLDQQAEKTGQDSAIIRKAIGSVLLDIKEYDKAIPQLQLAAQLQPTDAETQQKLIEALDAADRKDDATKQMLTQLDFDRHNLEVYKQLAKRLQSDDAMAERAATSLVEAAPLEAENHQALAELREKQDRWDDAIAQWRQVAELRKLEPTGLLKLATAQVHEEQWSDAKATIKKLNQKTWPSRFDNLEREIRKLQKQLPE